MQRVLTRRKAALRPVNPFELARGTIISLRRWFETHVHFRLGVAMEMVAPYTTRSAGIANLEPNVQVPRSGWPTDKPPPHIERGEDLAWYKSEYARRVGPQKDFEPRWMFSITDDTTVEDVRDCFALGASTAKVYAKGQTTGGHRGMSNFKAKNAVAVFAECEKLGIVIQYHGENGEYISLDKERGFHSTFEAQVRAFPGTLHVFEHITDASTVQLLRRLHEAGFRVGGSVTAHHLVLTLEDIIGGSLNGDAFCKPIAKRPEDRDGLIQAVVVDGVSFLWMGTDSAYHTTEAKQTCGCAGIFSAPTEPEGVIAIFEAFVTGGAELVRRLDNFLTLNACKAYGIKPPTATVDFVREPWVVPDVVGEGHPFGAGQTYAWQQVTS